MSTGDPFCPIHGFSPCGPTCIAGLYQSVKQETNNNMTYTNDIQDPAVEADGLEYKDEVSTRLIDTVHEYLEFSSTRDLLKLLAANL